VPLTSYPLVRWPSSTRARTLPQEHHAHFAFIDSCGRFLVTESTALELTLELILEAFLFVIVVNVVEPRAWRLEAVRVKSFTPQCIVLHQPVCWG
jgi:hypothetical protein